LLFELAILHVCVNMFIPICMFIHFTLNKMQTNKMRSFTIVVRFTSDVRIFQAHTLVVNPITNIHHESDVIDGDVRRGDEK